MRQTVEGGPDAKFRRALENMRYGACDDNDLTFLRTLVARRGSSTKCLSLPLFRNVSIITSRNSYKDRFNDMGCKQFAAGRGEELHVFHSVDFMGNNKDITAPKVRLGKQKSTKVGLPESLQRLLWSLEPHTCEHIPAVLRLCKGMPVMLRYNDATELCITKGQEGLVVGWDSLPGKYGTKALETVYVKLLNPPKSIQLPGLDKNVVPIPKTKNSIMCDLPDKKSAKEPGLPIERQQVNILPNFSMTDYASQGKSRKVNVVDLSMAKDVQNVYTALSRSCSAEGTVILQSADLKTRIASGIDGYQRQEFRELAWLDKLTEARYEGTLPDGVKGEMRYPLIKSFRSLVGSVPSITDDRNLREGISEIKAHKNRKILNEVYSENNVLWDHKALSFPQGPGDKDKRKRQGKTGKGAEEANRKSQYNDANGHITKRGRIEGVGNEAETPKGFIWDSRSYSCAYDALFTVLFNIWYLAQDLWGPRFASINYAMKILSDNFKQVASETLTMEEARDNVREVLFNASPEDFPKGRQFASIDLLVNAMLSSSKVYGSTSLVCGSCGYKGLDDKNLDLKTVTTIPEADEGNHALRQPASLCVEQALFSQAASTAHHCPSCANSLGTFSFLWRQMQLSSFPDILAIELADVNIKRLEPTLRLPSTEAHCLMTLRGVLYHSRLSAHFTCRVVDPSGGVWYHDGAVTGRDVEYESLLVGGDDNAWLNHGPQDYRRVYAIYARLQ
ncbi:hypothetical protein DFP72DRAFT_816147 [Ephemerocybe angulata]|uniref:USP domain-containing protein n=1 Tax=Ephemerocybe angulata TaxID=980116 RepID=A0A8H6M185_9AGAR|nr:hypothetical protein DFP72DRAFT_816147 [Tulosesus angulatus]